jgi:hypothetical protein
MFENRVLRREEVPRRWGRRFHNEGVHNLYFSPNIRMIKSRKLRWAGYVAGMG